MICTGCGEDFPDAEKYRVSAKCRSCRSAQQAAGRTRTAEQRRAESRASYRRRPRERFRKNVKAWRDRTPGAVSAHNAVAYAVRTGALVKPSACESCGTTGRVEAHHHKGYDFPLDVLWVCRPCHKKAHATEMTA